MNTMIKVTFSSVLAQTALNTLETEIRNLHNFIANAIESPSEWQGEHSARELVRRLREAQDAATAIRRAIRESAQPAK